MKKKSRVALLYISFLFLAFVMRNNVLKKATYIYSDAEGYYAYLPKWFIYGDFEELPVRTQGRYRWEKTGKYFNKYSCGTAIAQLPFFLGSHLIAHLSQSNADGYSKVYDKGILVACVTYVFIGLFFLYKLMRLHAINAWIAGMVTGILFFGTNLFYYTFGDAGMSHGYSFGLISVFVFFSFKYKAQILTKKPIAIAILIALTGMIRLPNLIVILLPAYFIAREWNSFNDVISWVKGNFHYLLLIPLPFIELYTLQMLQWHEMTGRWILNGYGLVEQGFIYWDNPRIVKVLFDIKNGWFVYSPVMLISIVLAIFYVRKYKEAISFPLVCFVLLTYIFGSWWVWSFAGGFGHRAFIDFLSVLILPLALALNDLWDSQKRGLFYSIAVILIVFTYFSFGMAIKYEWPWEPPSWTWDKYFRLISDIALFRYE